MKTSYTLAARAAILTAIVLGITACSTQPVSVCPLNSGFLWNQPDNECLRKEQQNAVQGYMT